MYTYIATISDWLIVLNIISILVLDLFPLYLTYWRWVTHMYICVCQLVIIVLCDGLCPFSVPVQVIIRNVLSVGSREQYHNYFNNDSESFMQVNAFEHAVCKTSLCSRFYVLTHLPVVPHICVNESGQHWFRSWLVAYSAPSHYLNQCWVIDNWTLRNKPQWHFNQKYKTLQSRKCICNYRLRNGDHFVHGEIS